MIKKVLLSLLVISLTISSKAQQDSQFTQYVFNGLHINPAYAGTKGDFYIQSFYRSQWQGVNGAPKTLSLAADGSFNDGNVGLGLLVANDQIGAQKNLTAFANYAYKIRLDDDENSILSFGIAGGMSQFSVDGNKLYTANPGDGAVPLVSQNKAYPDARVGVYYHNEQYFLGFSATNIIARYMADKNKDDLLIPVPRPHFYFTAGALFPINEDVQIKPVILVKDDIKGPTSLDLNAFFLLKERVWLGGFYRASFNIHNNNLQRNLPTQNSMGLIAEIFATEDLRVGYSYDYSLNKLRNYNSGSHEISVGLYINRRDYKKIRQTRCYSF